MCMIDGVDWVDTLSEGKRKARKAHVCHECHRTIEPSETYGYTSYKLEGYLMEHKICDRCEVARQWLIKNCGGFVYEMIGDDIRDHARDYPYLAEPLGLIADRMRSKWLCEAGNLMPVPAMPPPITIEDKAHA